MICSHKFRNTHTHTYIATVERKIKIKEKPIDSSPCLVLSREIYVCSFFHGVAQKTTKLTIMNNL